MGILSWTVFRLGLILKRRKFTLSRSDPGDAKNDEELENVLSLLQSRVDGSLDSSLDAIALGLHDGFVVKVARTPFIMGKNLIRFSMWVMKKPGLNHLSRIWIGKLLNGLYLLIKAVKELETQELNSREAITDV
ncbi:hypothetical protein PVK06_014147 [Gossypium arboreum]|uniref:Uncharacterized protein n=1 Tax=Gossypium arboreum TaxID=29729 RepID=A0ABR0PTM0_GOSAR|nr:hypothetical protein PVK06_014147 [Gossypium arboreum]